MNNPLSHAASVVDLLRWRADSDPDRIAYTFLSDAAEKNLTYGGLDLCARMVASHLQSAFHIGDRIVLMQPSGLEYIFSLFGCLYAGMIAVPLYPISRGKDGRSDNRVVHVLKDCEPRAALVTSGTEHLPECGVEESPPNQLSMIDVTALKVDEANSWRQFSPKVDDVAVLQYTSGSTSEPKGAMVTHANILANEVVIQAMCESSETSTFVGWLPMFHDMGLIGNILHPLYIGSHSVLMSPLSFLQKPVRWLRAISRFRGEISGGPNFAYDLAARKVTSNEAADLDLSTWAVAFNGAERIRPATLDRFASAFEGVGFRREAFYPCYGMAEATLMITGSHRLRAPCRLRLDTPALAMGTAVESNSLDASATELVGCGRPSLGHRAIIADPVTHTALKEGAIGEIWFQGPSVVRGYWKNPQASRTVFDARTADTSQGPFLRTGDLGFIHNDSLYPTGRLKDLIIVRGQNHHPEDIEACANSSHDAVRFGAAAAFAIEVEGQERLAVALEVDRNYKGSLEELAQSVRQAISLERELQCRAVILVKQLSLPKTSSGKIQRHVIRKDFESGKLENLYVSLAPLDDVAESTPLLGAEAIRAMASPQREKAVRTWLENTASRWMPNTLNNAIWALPLTSFGIDSLLAAEFSSAVQSQLGIVLPAATLLDGMSLDDVQGMILVGLTEDRSFDKAITVNEAEGPMTAAQRALWYHAKVAPDSAAYHVGFAVRTLSPIDEISLHAGLSTLVQRHPALRTSFHSDSSDLIQRVNSNVSIDYERISNVTWSRSNVRDYLTAELSRPFELSKAPLMRVRLIDRGNNASILLFAFHHIVTDMRSVGLLVKELGSLYDAFDSGKAPALSSSNYWTPIRAGHVERAMLHSSEGEKHWEHWHKRLSSETAALRLPSDHPRPSRATYKGATEYFSFDPRTTRYLKKLAIDHGTTLYCVLLAGYQAFLHRITNATDITVGCPVSGRGRAELVQSIGNLTNTVAIRQDVRSGDKFSDHLKSTRRILLEDLKHGEYPFSALVERLQPTRDASRSPIFQTMLVLQQSPPSTDPVTAVAALGCGGVSLRVGKLACKTVNVPHNASQFDLTLMMTEAGDKIAGVAKFSTDLFTAETMRIRMAQLKQLFRSVARDPSLVIEDIPTVPKAQFRRTRAVALGPRKSSNSLSLIPGLIETQAELRPSAAAVYSDGDSIDFVTLNARANQIARAMRMKGAVKGTPVGVCLPRSFELIVTILGAQKCGSPYTPLDPNLPPARIRMLLEELGSSTLICSGPFLERLGQPPCSALCVDIDSSFISAQSNENLGIGIEAEDIAYVLFTSGSSGRPKGVAIQHGSVINLLNALNESVYRDRSTGLRLTMNAPASFDASVKQLVKIADGCTLCVVPESARKDIRAMRTFLRSAQVQILDCTPAHLNALLQFSALEGTEIDTILVGGEPITTDLWNKVASLRDIVAYNVYGPTECTVDSTICALDRAVVPSIGRPIANTETWVMDNSLRSSPYGSVGELCIAGEGVGIGYWRQPSRTAEKFVPHPYASAPGARIYRTGDQARYKHDGTIEYCGRVDTQIKVRGFRVEAGEVEAALLEYPGIDEVAVVLRNGAEGEKLTAYYTASLNLARNPHQLRSFLVERLPEYMVPTAFMQIDEMPRNFRGKLDRNGLPDPGVDKHQEPEDSLKQSTSLEDALARFLGHHLGTNRIGIHDNFFELGGHSLLAAEIGATLQEVLATEISITAMLLENLTVSSLAKALMRDVLIQEPTMASLIDVASSSTTRLPAASAAVAGPMSD